MSEINPKVFRKVPPGEPALWFYSSTLSLSLSLQTTVCGAVFVIRCFLLHLPQGVTCILPVLREGVLTGSPEQKEEAAKALGAVIKLTSPEALRPSVVNITGPLIRILGDRFAWTVKTALLETLTLLLAKVCTPPLPVLHHFLSLAASGSNLRTVSLLQVGIALKPFLPQLQTTFLKALQDSSRAVRLRAAEALGQLVSIHTKVDPLFTEQLSAIRNAEDSGVR